MRAYSGRCMSSVRQASTNAPCVNLFLWRDLRVMNGEMYFLFPIGVASIVPPYVGVKQAKFILKTNIYLTLISHRPCFKN